jgi:hypothetical protein
VICCPETASVQLISDLVGACFKQASSLPSDPETPTAPTKSSLTLIGSLPASASTRMYREPTELGSSRFRLTDAVEGWLNVRAL